MHTLLVTLRKNILMITMVVFCFQTNFSKAEDFAPVTLRSGSGLTEASMFEGDGNQLVVLVPGAKYDRESWYPLARRFQEEKIGALALDSAGDLEAAISFLKAKNKSRISAVGGSVGGEAIINAVNGGPGSIFKKIVVIAPYGGKPIINDQIEKLFMIDKKDWIVDFYEIDYLHKKSSEPKTLHVFKKLSAHAQEIFDSSAGEELTKMIIGFINK